MTIDERMSDEECAYYAAKRRADFERDGRELPERVLLRDARNGDELAAQELLLWPKLFRREMIDPEVYDAIVDGALSIAAYVADQTRSPKPDKHIDLSITPIMFFNNAIRVVRNDGNKSLSAKERYIEFVVARDDKSDSTRLTDDDLRIALTTSFEKAVPDNLPDNRRPKTYQEAEARLVTYVQHKYQRKDRADLHFQRKVMDPEICKLLIGWSYPQHYWHRDAKEPFPYPPEWDKS